MRPSEACQVTASIVTIKNTHGSKVCFHTGLGNYQLRDQYHSALRGTAEMHLIPAIPVEEIVNRVQCQSDATSMELEVSPL